MLPHVILYNAVSLDGRITGFNADIELYYDLASKWDIDAVNGKQYCFNRIWS